MMRMLRKKTVLAAITRFPNLSDALAVLMIEGELPHNAPAVKVLALPGDTVARLFQQVHIIAQPGIGATSVLP
jgi:hypothetical protein